MNSKTRALWEKQDRHTGDRSRLFQAVQAAIPAKTVLYPGCYVDLAPSFWFPDVTYVDMDKRAPGFFADRDGIDQIIAENGVDPAKTHYRFIHSDYTRLDLPEQSFDLLVSLYAGFISEACTRFLKIGGTLLDNPSHGDVAMASIDPRLQLAGVVTARDGNYQIRMDDLDTYMIPKKPVDITPELLHETRRGIAYTKSAFAYLFRRVD